MSLVFQKFSADGLEKSDFFNISGAKSILKSHSPKSKKGAEAPFVVQTNLSVIKLECFYDDEP